MKIPCITREKKRSSESSGDTLAPVFLNHLVEQGRAYCRLESNDAPRGKKPARSFSERAFLAAWKDGLHYFSAAALQIIPHVDHIDSSLNDAANEPPDQGKDACEDGGSEPERHPDDA